MNTSLLRFPLQRKKPCKFCIKKGKEEEKRTNSIMRFVLINIKRVTELIFLIMEYAMYFMQNIRNIQRSQR